MHVFYSGRSVIEIQPGHTLDDVHEPEPAGRDDVLRAHTADYHDRFVGGALSVREVRRLGLPWSPALVQRGCGDTG